MSKEKLLELARKYVPSGDLSGDSLANDLFRLSETRVGSKTYFEIKSRILESVSLSCIGFYSNRDIEQATFTKVLLEEIIMDCIEKEAEL